MGQTRFIVNKTFTSDDLGLEFFQGAIYEINDITAPHVEQWMAEGKIRDPDEGDESEGDEAANDPDDDEDTPNV